MPALYFTTLFSWPDTHLAVGDVDPSTYMVLRVDMSPHPKPAFDRFSRFYRKYKKKKMDVTDRHAHRYTCDVWQ